MMITTNMITANSSSLGGNGNAMNAEKSPINADPIQSSEHTSAATTPEHTGSPQGSECLKYPFTDVGNAQRLVAKFGKDLRYCPPWRKWLIWNGARWKVDKTGDIFLKAKKTIRDFQRAAWNIQDDDKRHSAIKHGIRSENQGRITAMVQLAETEPGIPVEPKELDPDPYLLNCENGTVDLKTGKVYKHRREDLLTTIARVKYDPRATCPVFDSFLQKITNNDPELARYLQQIVGYALTGDVTEKAIFFLYGDGNNGKTTFLEIIRAALGDYAGQVPVESLMTKSGDGAISNDIAQLQGRRFVTSSEAEQGKKLAVSKVKQLTGMGTLQARFLYGEFFEFTPTFKIFMDANHKPEIRGNDPAIWNRIKLIPFTVEIPPDEIDKKLLQKLKGELSGILAWAVRGCLDWQQHGLVEPKSVVTATRDYREEMDTLAHYLDERCVFGDGELTSKELCEDYTKWCREHHEEPVSTNQFGRALTKKMLKPTKVNGERGWSGIAFKISGPLFEPAEAPQSDAAA